MSELSSSWAKVIREFKQFGSVSTRLAVLGLIVAIHIVLIVAANTKYRPRGKPLSGVHSAGKTLDVELLDSGIARKPERESAGTAITLNAPDLPGPPPPPDIKIGTPDSLFDLGEPEPAYYLPTNQITEKPVVKLDVSSDVALVLASNQPRSAVLRLLINENGSIDQVIMEQGDFSETEKQALINACMHMEFEPGKKDGSPVKTEMRIQMTIEPAGPTLPFARPPQ
ncbi:hypothetical protein GCM10011396_17910 [Undibacterium terreum]|uniref:TonB C-terminal domain-containing protein n=1 Tax=Undibacterium terreum TaxID=1224302 RepID=A0A916UEY7_9BURK|nr:hypothetical protein GCM10011396_17910 [Undibacterium terreum]